MAIRNSKADGAAVVRRYQEGRRLRVQFDTRVDLLAPYIEPTRGLSQVQNPTPGQTLMSRTYISEGIWAADLAAKFIGGELHGAGSQWFSLVDERDELNDIDEVREWLEESRDRQLGDLSNSNFYAEAYESDIDWIGFGAGSMLVEQRPMLPYLEQHGYRGTRFTVDKVGRFVIQENGWQEVDACYREFRLDATGAKNRFGLNNLPERIKAAHEKGDNLTQFTFIHAVYPRPESEKTFGNRAMPWASVYVELNSAEVVAESGYETYPFLNPRWSRAPGEAYGRGLGDLALNNLLTLNTATKMSFEAWALSYKPPIAQAHESVIGALKLKPWGVTSVRLSAGRSIKDMLQPLDLSGRPDISKINEEELRRSVHQMFHVDQLRELLMVQGRKEMTAFEFAQKINLLNKILGPVYGRWESEFGNPLIARHFNLLLENGVFSDPPDILLELGGKIKVRFESPLARAQRMEEIEAMNQALADVAPVAELQWKQAQLTGRGIDRPVLDNYDFDRYVQKINQTRGVPATVTRSEREVGILRQSRAEREQEQQAGQEALMATEGARNIAPLVKAAQEGARAA